MVLGPSAGAKVLIAQEQTIYIYCWGEAKGKSVLFVEVALEIHPPYILSNALAQAYHAVFGVQMGGEQEPSSCRLQEFSTDLK